jgi:hypothetical protein
MIRKDERKKVIQPVISAQSLTPPSGHTSTIKPRGKEAGSMAVLHERFVQVQGRVQNQDGVVHLKAKRVWPLSMSEAATKSHDFH